jgi:hypothetical protein
MLWFPALSVLSIGGPHPVPIPRLPGAQVLYVPEQSDFFSLAGTATFSAILGAGTMNLRTHPPHLTQAPHSD